jgi:hypothetical protein
MVSLGAASKIIFIPFERLSFPKINSSELTKKLHKIIR